MENYALIARQEEQIKALKTENDYLKKIKNPTEIENANLSQRNDALELENQSLQSEIQVITEKHNLQVEELEPDMENYALIARQEKQVEALKTENDYLKKVKNPTEIENANLRQRSDALELENQSLQSEIQVITEKHNLQVEELESDLDATEQDAESAKSQNLELIRQHHRERKFNVLRMAFIGVLVSICVGFMFYYIGIYNGNTEAEKRLVEAEKRLAEKRLAAEDEIELAKVINYFGKHRDGFPTAMAVYIDVERDRLLLILNKLETWGIVTKTNNLGIDNLPKFKLKD